MPSSEMIARGESATGSTAQLLYFTCSILAADDRAGGRRSVARIAIPS